MDTSNDRSNSLAFIAACTGMLLFGMAMLSLGTANTYLAKKFLLDQEGVGSLAALLPFGILAGSLVFGPMADRYGYKLPLVGGSLLLFVALEVIPLSESFAPVQFAFFLIGFGGGILNGATNALVADISAENRGARLSLLGVFFGIGALATPMVTGLLLSAATYEAIIRGLGAVVILPLAFFLTVRFPPPKQLQGFPLKEGARLVRHPTLLLLSLILFFQSGVEGLMNNWSPLYLQGARGFPVERSLFLLTVLAASLTAMRLVLGGLLKRVSSTRILIFSIATVAAGIILLGSRAGVAGSMVAMILIGAGLAATFPVVLGLIGGMFPHVSGTAFGIALVIALGGNTILNYLLGVTATWRGIEIFPWYLLATLCGLAVFFWLGTRSYTRHTKEEGQ